MALPIFKEIERLITEHGSAAILKERNALLKNQLDLLKAEFTKLERRNAELERRLATSERKEQFVEENVLCSSVGARVGITKPSIVRSVVNPRRPFRKARSLFVRAGGFRLLPKTNFQRL